MNLATYAMDLEDRYGVAGFLVKPIQGEAGVIVPEAGYLKKAIELSKKARDLGEIFRAEMSGCRQSECHRVRRMAGNDETRTSC